MSFKLNKACCFLLIMFVAGCGNTSISDASSAPQSESSSSALSSSSISEVSSISASSSEIISSQSTTSASESSLTSTTSEGSSIPSDDPFTPGEKGVIPHHASLVETPGVFGGLFIEQIDQQPNYFGGGTSAEALLGFPEPWTMDASFFRLQTYQDSTSSWINYGDGDDYVTDYNNFIVPVIGGQRFRLLVIGGPLDGHVSNEVELTYPALDTYFTSYGLDESMYISGVMSPFVGRGLEAEFTIVSYPDGEEIEDALLYQWYRVNPYTFEHIAIPDATTLTYITTMDDLGFYIAIVATGDNISASGRYEVISDYYPITLPIKTFATNGSSTGFTLHFEYILPSFSAENMNLLDEEYNQVEVASAVLHQDGTSAVITLSEATESTTLYFSYFDQYWSCIDPVISMGMIEITLNS